MPVFKIQHITKYEYDHLVKESINEIRVLPYYCNDQEVLQQSLSITGHPNVHSFIDYWGNQVGTFSILAPHRELVIENRLMVRTVNPPATTTNYTTGFDALARDVGTHLNMIELATPDRIAAAEAMEGIVGEVQGTGESVATTVETSSHYIYNNFQYIKGITSVETTVDEIMNLRSGVCQDFAHVLLQMLRTMGIPSRYVSGYICPNKNGMRGEGATHAWVEAWIPGQGWAGIDPTNDVWVTNKHVKLAVGRNFNDCTPMKGTFKGQAEQKLSVYVSVAYEDGETFEELNRVDTGREKDKSATPPEQEQPQQ